jgi:hypothetical protein
VPPTVRLAQPSTASAKNKQREIGAVVWPQRLPVPVDQHTLASEIQPSAASIEASGCDLVRHDGTSAPDDHESTVQSV